MSPRWLAEAVDAVNRQGKPVGVPRCTRDVALRGRQGSTGFEVVARRRP